MTLGEKIKNARINSGLSQAELAGDEITRNMLSSIENGKASPSLKTLEYIAERLSLSLAQLFADSDNILEQKKVSHIKEIVSALKNREYKECERMILELGYIDDELALIMTECSYHLGKANVLNGALATGARYLELVNTYSALTVYDTSKFVSLSKMYMALSANIQAPLLDFDIKEFEEAVVEEMDYEFFKYFIQDITYKYNNVDYRDHLIAKDLIKQRKYSQALNYLTAIESRRNENTYNSYVIFGVYTDLEICYKQLAKYELAYRYASKRLSLLEAFKE